jgi:isoleucyl-tRNA synthetase
MKAVLVSFISPLHTGEADFELAKANDVPVVHALDDNGFYFEDIAKQLYKLMPWKDADEPLEVWSSNKDIAKALHKAGIVWKVDYIQHEYPFNPRSKQRIMYRAIPSWFFDIDGSKTLMLEKNENINWFPEHLKHGRFQKNIEQAPDWNLSRDRFWATAMPVWKGTDADGNERVKVVGSYDELKELSGVELEDYHRPWVDDIEFDIDGVHYTRIEKVLDGWFESGSMPFAQFHYPFENKEKFEANFPGDFIVEYIGQVRAWFYYVHAVNTALFGSEAFRNVITTGTLAGNDGRKMSKSLGNYTDPNELMDKFSADSLRFLLIGSPLLNGEDFSLLDKDVGDVARKLSMIWNMYDFFTMYAEVDGWEFDGELKDPSEQLENPLDQWIVSRIHQLTQEVEKHMDVYDLPSAVKPILPFIEDASNWYVRRSRRRFWKSEDDKDKNNAYTTLHYMLTQLSMVLAPFTPFLAEELYQKLTGGESVHLLDWPAVGYINEPVVKDMETVREYVNQALSLRAKEKIKIRQPLASVSVPTLGESVSFEDILTDELNVKKVVQSDELALDFAITPELKREGLVREVIRHVQAARKDAGLNVDDRIKLALMVQPGEAEELEKAIDEHSKTIGEETLTAEFTDVQDGYDVTVKVEDNELRICLEKA